MRIRRYSNPADFRAVAEPWLVRAEAENNLLLGLLPSLVNGRHPYAEPIYLAIAQDEAGAVCGCAFRTPPFKLGLTRFPHAAMLALVADISEVYSDVPAVIAPPPVAEAFAAAWCDRHGVDPELGMRQQIYQLDAVAWPVSLPPGSFRRAAPAEIQDLAPWGVEFAQEAGVEVGDQANLVRHLVNDRNLFVWEDGGVRCMAAAMGQTPNGVRIGFVYTPVGQRRRGYASALVAALSHYLLDHGRRHCFLYTDLANTTSNAIYARIGYRPVCEVLDIRLG